MAPPFIVHKLVFLCLRFRYSMFKTKKYLNNRKVAEAVNRNFSRECDLTFPILRRSSFLPLFFPNSIAEAPVVITATGVFPCVFGMRMLK